MLDFMTAITNELRLVTSEAYHDRNTAAQVTYPYLTFDITRESLERNVDGFYLDVDIFDHSTSYTGLFALETALTDHFKDNRKLTDGLYIRFSFLGSNPIPTGDETIKRRNVRFYVRTDWRKK